MGNSEFRALRSELSTLQQRLDQKPAPVAPQSEVAWLEELYGTALLLPLATRALQAGTVYDCYYSTFKPEIAIADNRVILNLLFTEPALNTALKRVLAPLVAYLMRVRLCHSKLDALKYLKLDTLRENAMVGSPLRNDVELRIFSKKLSAKFFALVCAFLRAEVFSGGVRTAIGTTLRAQVWARAPGLCYCCEEVLTAHNWECAHLVSVEHGGLTVLNNLCVCCRKCNRAMAEMHLHEYLLRQNLPGVRHLTLRDQQMWRGIILLTDFVTQPHISKLPYRERLAAIAKLL